MNIKEYFATFYSLSHFVVRSFFFQLFLVQSFYTGSLSPFSHTPWAVSLRSVNDSSVFCCFSLIKRTRLLSLFLIKNAFTRLQIGQSIRIWSPLCSPCGEAIFSFNPKQILSMEGQYPPPTPPKHVLHSSPFTQLGKIKDIFDDESEV